jgi:hypothetical protein
MDSTSEDTRSSANRRGLRTIAIVFLAYALLVAPHEGEFWPFSIYPMFSSAGNAWERSLIVTPHDVPPSGFTWEESFLSELTGDVVPLRPLAIPQNDLSDFLRRTADWDARQRETVEHLISRARTDSGPIILYRIRGELVQEGVNVIASPVLLLESAGKMVLNPAMEGAN